MIPPPPFFIADTSLFSGRRGPQCLLRQVTLLQICQSKRSCKCYGKKLCVALSLKENIVLRATPLRAPGHGDVIFAAYLSPGPRTSLTAAIFPPFGPLGEPMVGPGLRWCSCTNAVIDVCAPGFHVTRTNTEVARVNT